MGLFKFVFQVIGGSLNLLSNNYVTIRADEFWEHIKVLML